MLEMLEKGKSYVATTTGVLNGERIYHAVTFVASRDQLIEPFIQGRGPATPDQVRVFHADRHGSTPLLVVAGSIGGTK